METTSRRSDPATGPGTGPGGGRSVVEPLLQELQRIAGHAESQRAAADQALIAELRAEIAALRAAVAHLRAGTTALPRELRPVVARAMVATQDTTPQTPGPGTARRPGPDGHASTG